jgi:hypothetical protein
MEIALSYLVGVVVFQGLFAFRSPHVDGLTAFALCICWPVSIVLIAFVFLLDAMGWDIDTAENTKMFGYRKPTNTKVRGFAVTVFGTEFQFYSMKKA